MSMTNRNADHLLTCAIILVQHLRSRLQLWLQNHLLRRARSRIYSLATLAGLCLQYCDGWQIAVLILLHNALCSLLRLLLLLLRLLLLDHFGRHCLDDLLSVGLLQLYGSVMLM